MNSVPWLFLLGFMTFVPNLIGLENSAPNVYLTILSSSNKSNGGKEISYNIQITDKEDGDSAYDEISGNEVLLQANVLPDSLEANKFLNNENRLIEPKALSLIKTSNCFNCHAMRNKLIGPSFDRIASTYLQNEETIKTLVKKIGKGTTGKWGDAPMPANADLSNEEMVTIVKWILQEGNSMSRYYQVGLKGIIWVPEKRSKQVFILTASYLDHGLNGQSKKYGRHSIIVK